MPPSGPTPAHEIGNTATPSAAQGAGSFATASTRANGPRSSSSWRSAIGAPADLEERLRRAAQPPRRPARDDRARDASSCVGYGQGAFPRRATPCRIRIIWSWMRPLLASTRPVSPSNGLPSSSVACPPAPMHDRRAAHQIPGVQRALPVAVEPAARDEAEIQRRRAEPPRPLRRRGQRANSARLFCTGLR